MYLWVDYVSIMGLLCVFVCVCVTESFVCCNEKPGFLLYDFWWNKKDLLIGVANLSFNWISGLLYKRKLSLALQMWSRHMSKETKGPREETIDIVSLKGHAVKLTSKYLFLYWLGCAELNPGQRHFLLNKLAFNAEGQNCSRYWE